MSSINRRKKSEKFRKKLVCFRLSPLCLKILDRLKPKYNNNKTTALEEIIYWFDYIGGKKNV